MKKIALAAMLVVFLSAPLQAKEPKPRVWAISYPDMMYMRWNDNDTTRHFSIFVYKEYKNKSADKVTLVCNGQDIPALVGAWTGCDVAPHKPVSFIVRASNFVNGAEGDYKF